MSIRSTNVALAGNHAIHCLFKMLHYDPRFYDSEHFEERRNTFAWQIWEKDLEKKNIAIKNGFKFFTVWQYDWEQFKSDEQKVNFINTMIQE